VSAAQPPRRGLVELLLPGGHARAAMVLGSACPERIRPAAPDPAEEGAHDLAIVAPSTSEAEPAWLGDAIERSVTSLEPGGVVYLLLPPPARGRARRVLRAHGLVLETPLLHLPSASRTRQLVPLERRAARDSFARVVPLTAWKRLALRLAFAAGGGRLLAAVLPDTALVARRPGGGPLLAWLWAHTPPGTSERQAAIASSWAPAGAGVIVHPVGDSDASGVVAKVSLQPAAQESREAESLALLGTAAERAGARVPELIAEFDLNGLPVLVETRVRGRVAAPELMRRRRLLGPTFTTVADWLGRWQAGTARATRLSREQLERELLEPAELVAPLLPGGDAYLDGLRALCERVEGTPTPLVDSHNDLTMWNVVLRAHGGLGVVDWEEGRRRTLPLKDFFYMAADAAAAIRAYRDRPAAVAACFERGGMHSTLVLARQSRMVSALDVDREVVNVCFHACWLGHAANEHRAAGPADERPFLEIVRWLAGTLGA
jgi:hypothetical protein